MGKAKIGPARAFVIVFASLFWLLRSLGEAQPITVNCTAQSLQTAINNAAPGATIQVTGNCNENIFIGEEKDRLIIDGQNTATLNGPDQFDSTVIARSRGITIKNFTISGGSGGILVQRGGTAEINGNRIQGTGGNGLQVNTHSFAIIINNTIQNNAADGIVINENSSARIGFMFGDDITASPNTIQNNGDRGITVVRSSNARIIGNQIISNIGEGILVARNSHADAASNLVNANGLDGILVTQNSGVNLGNDTGTTIFDSANSTTVNNGGFGIRCAFNSYADGRQGSLNGGAGPISVTGGCINSLIP